jgi:hypothetical protein
VTTEAQARVGVLRRLTSAKAPEATAFLAPSLIAWRWAMIVLVVMGIAHTLLGKRQSLTEYFFYLQDLGVAGLMLLLLNGLYLVHPQWLPAKVAAPGWRTVLLLALTVTAFAWAGASLIYDGYALSMDEFLARFDAQILSAGQLAAPVAPAWRLYVPALQPMFGFSVPGHAYWLSNYLPVNAAFLALASRAGAESLMPAVWAGVSVAAVFGIARRLWPDRPNAAWVAAVLLATSPQLLVTAMTPYAMSAHLALNLAWLWLVLRGGKLGHGAAAGVAFLATGLHQLVFHPLFAAPFVLEMWLAKRWKPALWHTCAYAAIGLFWSLYPALLRHQLEAVSVAAEATGHNGILVQATGLLAHFDPGGIGLMAKNLVRFATWQSLLAVPLAMIAFIPALRAGGTLRALALSIILTTVAMFVLLPYQGHGWGYRYLHGLMGSACLLAAWGWTRLGEGAPPAQAKVQGAVLATSIAATLLILLPLRAWQAHAFVHPYAVAERTIQAMDADLVLVDGTGVWFGDDLVRNDPFLTNRPIVLDLVTLRPAHVRDLCSRYSVAVYGQSDAKRAGIRTVAASQNLESRRMDELRKIVDASCRRPGVAN